MPKLKRKVYRIEIKVDGRWVQAAPRQTDVDQASVVVYRLQQKHGYEYGVNIRVVMQDP